MKLPYDLIVFDLEANQPSGRIIEIGAVRLSRTFETSDSCFSGYVNPNEPIHQDIQKLCGLDHTSLADIANSPSLQEVNKAFYTWATQAGKNIILASWGNYDVSELHAQDPTCQFRRKAIDIKSICAWEMARWGLKARNSLAGSCELFNVTVEKPQHKALPDAITTARLLIELHHQNTRFKATIDRINNQLA